LRDRVAASILFLPLRPPRSSAFSAVMLLRQTFTARSVISRPRSMIANPSSSWASVTMSGGFVKKVFQRTKV